MRRHDRQTEIVPLRLDLITAGLRLYLLANIAVTTHPPPGLRALTALQLD